MSFLRSSTSDIKTTESCQESEGVSSHQSRMSAVLLSETSSLPAFSISNESINLVEMEMRLTRSNRLEKWQQILSISDATAFVTFGQDLFSNEVAQYPLEQ